MSVFDKRVRKNGQSACIARRRSSPSGWAARKRSTAVPKPNQPGSVMRLWPQEKLQGMARRSSIRRFALREAGREPMVSSAISEMGVAAKK